MLIDQPAAEDLAAGGEAGAEAAAEEAAAEAAAGARGSRAVFRKRIQLQTDQILQRITVAGRGDAILPGLAGLAFLPIA